MDDSTAFVGNTKEGSWKDRMASEDMLEHLKIMNNYLQFLKTLALIKAKGITLKIWKGEGIDMSSSGLGLKLKPYVFTDKPTLTTSNLLEDHVAFIVAGVGIAAGKEAYKALQEHNIPLEWSDESISLEEQLNVE